MKTNSTAKQDPEKVIKFTINNWYWISPLLKVAYKKIKELIQMSKSYKPSKMTDYFVRLSIYIITY